VQNAIQICLSCGMPMNDGYPSDLHKYLSGFGPQHLSLLRVWTSCSPECIRYVHQPR